MQSDKVLISALGASRAYREYEAAFSGISGLPLSLTPPEAWDLPHRDKAVENPFCALMSRKSASCAACLRVQDELCELPFDSAHSVTCDVGMVDSVVPLRVGERLIGLLQTGQVFLKAPGAAQVERVLKLVDEWGLEKKPEEIKHAFLQTRVMTREQHESAIALLRIFARHLEELSNQLMFRQEAAEPPVIRRAKAYILEHQEEHLSLEQVAKAVNTSSFYFCKLFKDATGINFTEYVSRSRIEHACKRLQDPHARVSEIAYEVGFQSLTHFNRIFRKITGKSPSEFRQSLALN